MIKLGKTIWYYLLYHKIPITALQQSSSLNKDVNSESKEKPYSSQWLLCLKVLSGNLLNTKLCNNGSIWLLPKSSI